MNNLYSSHYRSYNKGIPHYLHDKPREFVLHCLEQLAETSDFRFINNLRECYEVNFENAFGLFELCDSVRIIFIKKISVKNRNFQRASPSIKRYCIVYTPLQYSIFFPYISLSDSSQLPGNQIVARQKNFLTEFLSF